MAEGDRNRGERERKPGEESRSEERRPEHLKGVQPAPREVAENRWEEPERAGRDSPAKTDRSSAW